MMHKSKNNFKNFYKTCCLLTDEGLAVASSDPTESSLANNVFILFIWDVDEADIVKKSLILHFDITKIKTSLVDKISDDGKVDVIPLRRAIEKGAFILRLRWDLDKSVTLSNRTIYFKLKNCFFHMIFGPTSIVLAARLEVVRDRNLDL